MYYVIYFDSVWKVVCDSFNCPLVFPTVKLAQEWLKDKPCPEEGTGRGYEVMKAPEKK